MKIIRSLMLLSLISSSFAVTVSVDNQSSCSLNKIGVGQLPEVKGHKGPDHIAAHSRGVIKADISQSPDESAFFDIYLTRCAGKESEVFIAGEQSSWYAQLEGGVPITLRDSASEEGSEVTASGQYNIPLVLIDAG